MNQQIVAGKYALIRRIASGGMAEVFLARQFGIDGFEKLVVLKRILPHLARRKEYVQMFLDEARTVADLHHSNIVTTFEVCEEKGMYFMVMEYLEGPDLRSIFKRCQQFQKQEHVVFVTGIVMDICAGLHYAHTKKNLKSETLEIVHRDVSPQNIIVNFDGVAKIFDFGIAKANHQTWQTRSGVLKGKYSYMSPEQALAQAIDARSDVFSLGIILYELTTLKRLFRRENEVLTCKAIIECDIPKPSRIDTQYDVNLEKIILKALSLKPKDRFSSAEEFRNVLEEYCSVKHWSHSSHKLGTFIRTTFSEEYENSVSSRGSTSSLHSQAFIWANQQEPSLSVSNPIAKHKSQSVIVAVLGSIIGIIFVFYFVVNWDESGKSNSLHRSLAVDFQQFKKDNEPVYQELSVAEVPKNTEKKIGRLKIVVHPWAIIAINGKKVGTTPLAPLDLPEGTHRLVAENPELNVKVSQNIVIRAGQDTLVKFKW